MKIDHHIYLPFENPDGGVDICNIPAEGGEPEPIYGIGCCEGDKINKRYPAMVLASAACELINAGWDDNMAIGITLGAAGWDYIPY